jgi:hypothetical protein
MELGIRNIHKNFTINGKHITFLGILKMKVRITEMYPLNSNGTRRMDSTTPTSVLSPTHFKPQVDLRDWCKWTACTGCALNYGIHGVNIDTTNISRSFKRHSGLK